VHGKEELKSNEAWNMTLNCDLKHIFEGYLEMMLGFFSISVSQSEKYVQHISLVSNYILSHLPKILVELPLPSSHTHHQISMASDSPKSHSNKIFKQVGVSCHTITLRDMARTRAMMEPISTFKARVSIMKKSRKFI